MIRVAIMQPTYLPWIGYFGLMQSVDVFILLDSVQFTRRSWQQRNQIKTTSGAQWLSVPVISKGKRDQRIDEVVIDQSTCFLEKHLRAIEHNYRKAPHFSELAPTLLPEFEVTHSLLVDLNINFILRIGDILGIKTQVLRSSAMQGSGNKADLLLSLCQEVRASEYISPPGSQSYLNETDIFAKAKLPVKYFRFQHPIYSQMYGDFLPYMSSLDFLFNCGKDSTALISKGCTITS